MEIFVEEIGTTPDSTLSQMFIHNRPYCFVIEDGHRDRKVAGETRIPAGRYRVVKRTVGSFFEKYRKQFGHKFSIELENVPEFSQILIHIGNTTNDTRGCLLVNNKAGMNAAGDYYGEQSTTAYRPLYLLIERAFERGEEVWIEIARRPVVDENTPVG